MKITDITNYVQRTPKNTNPSVLISLINKWVDLQDYVKKLNIEKLEDFLYSATYTDWNYAIGRKYAKKYIAKLGGCSSIRVNNLYGRNYDWFYNNQQEFIVKCVGNKNRYTSIGVASAPIEIQPESIESKKYDELFEVIPFLVLDGINEKGVVCNINVCPPGDKGYTTGTNPGKPDLNARIIPRYILDYAATAREAVDKLSTEVNITGLYSNDVQEEIHVMIGDQNDTYIVEFINNKIHVMSNTDEDFDPFPNEYPIMTNFHITDFDGELKTGFDVIGGISPKDTTLEPHAAGVERYQILLNAAENITSIEEMLEAMRSVKYTNAYNELTPYWYSELVGDLKEYGDFTIYQNQEDFHDIKEYFKQQFLDRDRNTGTTWQTVHSCVYELDGLTMIVIPQEGSGIYTFTLNE